MTWQADMSAKAMTARSPNCTSAVFTTIYFSLCSSLLLLPDHEYQWYLCVNLKTRKKQKTKQKTALPVYVYIGTQRKEKRKKQPSVCSCDSDHAVFFVVNLLFFCFVFKVSGMKGKSPSCYFFLILRCLYKCDFSVFV